MRLIGLSIRVPEEDHGAACDLLTHYLEVIVKSTLRWCMSWWKNNVSQILPFRH
jgi:hypothetical protein